MANIALRVNGSPYSLPEVPNETLASLLRERLRLTGTKIGCGEGRCGICTVLVEDQPVKSCLYPVKKAAGKSVLTIEGCARSPPPQAARIHCKRLSLPTARYSAVFVRPRK